MAVGHRFPVERRALYLYPVRPDGLIPFELTIRVDPGVLIRRALKKGKVEPRSKSRPWRILCAVSASVERTHCWQAESLCLHLGADSKRVQLPNGEVRRSNRRTRMWLAFGKVYSVDPPLCNAASEAVTKPARKRALR